MKPYVPSLTYEFIKEKYRRKGHHRRVGDTCAPTFAHNSYARTFAHIHLNIGICACIFARATFGHARLRMYICAFTFVRAPFAHLLKKLRKCTCTNMRAQMLHAQKCMRKCTCANVDAQCFMRKCHQPLQTTSLELAKLGLARAYSLSGRWPINGNIVLFISLINYSICTTTFQQHKVHRLPQYQVL